MGLISLTYVKMITVTFSNLNRISYYHANERSKMMIFNTSFPPLNNPPSLPEVEHSLQKIKKPTVTDFHFLSQWVCALVSSPMLKALPTKNK